MRDVLLVMAKCRFGCVGLVDGSGALAGIITDGDLSRHIAGDDFLSRRAADIMTRNPKIAAPGRVGGRSPGFHERQQDHPLVRAGGGRRGTKAGRYPAHP